MKSMTCRQLGGACESEFHADSFDEIADMSRAHGMEMAEKKDQAHMQAMERMKEMMKDPIAMSEWMGERKKEFEALRES